MIKIDGGLSTALEEQGLDLNNILWTGAILETDSQKVVTAHKSFIEAGAKIIISSSYQISYIGESITGRSDTQISALLRKSTLLAREAVENCNVKVAASIGPFGAALGDGSEYRGNYDVSNENLHDFHRKRIEVLAETKPDLFAVETIPSAQEAKIIQELLRNYDIPYWISFTCKNSREISEGELLSDAIADLNKDPNLIAAGINCTNPTFLPPLLESVKSGIPLVIYPNSGQIWDSDQKKWRGKAEELNLYIDLLARSNVEYLGGCCGYGSKEIQALPI
jgi:homocysteine S-methyltransferase